MAALVQTRLQNMDDASESVANVEVQKEVWLYMSLWENYRISHLIYYLIKQFPTDFTVSISSFKSAATLLLTSCCTVCPRVLNLIQSGYRWGNAHPTQLVSLSKFRIQNGSTQTNGW